jgi:hypothetical protein
MIEERQPHAPRLHAGPDLFEELGKDPHLVVRRAAAQACLAGDPVGLDLDRRGVAPLDGQPEIAISPELHVLDHRGHGPLDVADRLRRERGRPGVETLPAEGDVAHLVAQDQLHEPPDGRVGGLVDRGLEDVDEDLLRGTDEAGEDPLQRGVRVEGHSPHAVRAHHPGRRRILRLREIAAEPVGHEPGGLGVAPLLLRADGEEEAQIGMAVLEAEAQEERRALGDGAVLAPGAPAPVEARGEDLLLGIALGMELVPRDVRLGIPLERLGPLPQCPDVAHGGREL